MKSAVFSTESDKDFKELMALAKKLGISTRLLSEEETEDKAFAVMLSQSRTRNLSPIEDLLKEL